MQCYCSRGHPLPEQTVITSHAPAVRTETSQLTEDNEDFAGRGRYHQSEIVQGKHFDDDFQTDWLFSVVAVVVFLHTYIFVVCPMSPCGVSVWKEIWASFCKQLLCQVNYHDLITAIVGYQSLQVCNWSLIRYKIGRRDLICLWSHHSFLFEAAADGTIRPFLEFLVSIVVSVSLCNTVCSIRHVQKLMGIQLRSTPQQFCN